MEFNTNGYQVIRGALGQEAATLLGMQFQLVRDHMLFLNNGDTNDFQFMNDPQVKNSFSYYATVGFDTLLEYIRPKVAEVTGKRLLSAYSYARIYYKPRVLQEGLSVSLISLRYVCISPDDIHSSEPQLREGAQEKAFALNFSLERCSRIYDEY